LLHLSFREEALDASFPATSRGGALGRLMFDAGLLLFCCLRGDCFCLTDGDCMGNGGGNAALLVEAGLRKRLERGDGLPKSARG
jgi:hypothetical protein